MKIKSIVKSVIPGFLWGYLSGYIQLFQRNPEFTKRKVLAHGIVIRSKKKEDRRDDFVRQFALMCDQQRFEVGTYYVYPFDRWMIRLYPRRIVGICSITADFGKILESDLTALCQTLGKCSDKDFKARGNGIIESIERLASGIASRLESEHTERAEVLRTYFPAMLYRKPQTLDEAIQKLLFFNALFWQVGHRHIGLGRLDKILYEYYERDIREGRITDAEAKGLLRQMILTLGKDTRAKSVSLIGDTGQYILLGGIDDDGQTIQNRLTLLFLELFTELNIPDPKLILRVNSETNDEVWSSAIRCISTGCGSPLLMNERPIMENMVRFGYNTKNVAQVGTSACWEPLIIGKSFDQNNPFRSASPLKVLNDLLLADNKNYASFEELLATYKTVFAGELRSVVHDIDFDCSPLFTLFFDDCIRREKDFTQGGAIYAYHGAQVVGLPNAINALLNVKGIVFERRLYTLDDCRAAMRSNFAGYEDLYSMLLATGKKYGSTDAEVITLTNDLMAFVGEIMSTCTCNGEKIKVGFSSPAYVNLAKQVGASLDGRKAGEPFAVHISPISSAIDISEILDFASQLNYTGNRINGNVVDFILPSAYVRQPEKLKAILKDACDKGLFELQLNVLDKQTLIDAKAHPDKYPNLIVRVWGFSAYFNDLPEAFQDNLIRRAETYATA